MSKFAKRMSNKQRKGFTLVELVVVILIVAILAAAIFLGGATIIKQARERQVQNDLKNFGTYVQDMLYDNPDLQYYKGTMTSGNEGYGTQEGYTFDAKTTTLTGGSNVIGTVDFTAALDATKLPVLALLNAKYLTDDFQMGTIIDAWDNFYCWSYDMSPSTGTGDPASCIIVINSLGVNSLDETSDATTTAADTIAASHNDDLGTTYMSATEVVNALTDTGDDYGVVIVMIDGQVSVDYYGF